ncbi:MAG TPA: fibronectin type III-like domain-contianing protein, partial [Propionibacteriaceae bacterium]|nr:fibronectin type III-like domain-contianing protein [Propionibacteriaceae bacterium]
TSFAYEDAQVELRDDVVRVSLTVRNTGARDGAETVQLYVRNAPSAVFKADKELRGFAKVPVRAGGSERVHIAFPLSDLAYWDVRAHEWVLEGGRYEICLAASVADVRLALPLDVSGPPSNSPYPPEIDRAYAAPPVAVPACFAALLGQPVPADPPSRFTLDTRLVDARHTLVGRILYAAVLARARLDHRRARRLPDSLERDARVTNTHFVLRMMPNISLRAMVMSSRGALTYPVAEALVELAARHPVRAVRAIRNSRRRSHAS